MLKYFSSEDHDFRNLTKFVWHFSHFSVNYYTIMNFQPENRNKIGNIKKGGKRLTAGPHMAVGAGPAPALPLPLLCPARAVAGQAQPAAALPAGGADRRPGVR